MTLCSSTEILSGLWSDSSLLPLCLPGKLAWKCESEFSPIFLVAESHIFENIYGTNEIFRIEMLFDNNADHII